MIEPGSQALNFAMEGLHHQLHLTLDLVYDGHKRLEAIPKEEEVKL